MEPWIFRPVNQNRIVIHADSIVIHAKSSMLDEDLLLVMKMKSVCVSIIFNQKHRFFSGIRTRTVGYQGC